MRRTKRRLRRLALVAVAIPVAAWALERAADQAEVRGRRAAQLGRQLRRGAELLRGAGRGPLASRLQPPSHQPKQQPRQTTRSRKQAGQLRVSRWSTQPPHGAGRPGGCQAATRDLIDEGRRRRQTQRGP
jgi:hypothetical protein